jgi:AraC family transcriptional regulator
MTQARARPVQFLFPDGARLGEDNVILHAQARRHQVTEFAGPLSIKTVLSGAVTWTVGGHALVVDPTSFLVLGDGERYSMRMDEPRPMETACAFFRSGFVEEMAQDATTRLEASLDDPTRPAPSLPFLSRLHSDPERLILGAVQTMAQRCAGQLQPSAFEEDFLLLSNRLLLLYRQIQSQMSRIPALKSSTREELFRRLEAGREYVHSHVEEPVSLERVARAACLSRYHFHRAFTQAFRKTPHTYLTEVRLARAHALLRSGLPVTEVCASVGFTSPSSFSRLFRTHFRVAPSTIRKS